MRKYFTCRMWKRRLYSCMFWNLKTLGLCV